LAPDNGSTWAFLGLCEYKTGDSRQALSDIRKGQQLGLPDNPQFVSTVRNQAALICLRSHNFSAAIEELEPLVKMGDKSMATIENLGLAALGMPYLPSDVPDRQQPLVHLAGQAAWLLYAGGSDDGSKLFEGLVEKYPSQPGVHYLRGISLLDKEPGAARAEFLKELEIRPRHVPARQQIAILDIKAAQAEAAVKIAREALRLEPDNALSHAVLGRAFAHMNRYPLAVPEFETAVRLDPGNAQLHFSLAQAYRHVGREVEAQREQAEFERLKTRQTR
jgi:Flp pilus assembly protein TadD